MKAIQVFKCVNLWSVHRHTRFPEKTLGGCRSENTWSIIRSQSCVIPLLLSNSIGFIIHSRNNNSTLNYGKIDSNTFLYHAVALKKTDVT